MGPTAEQVRQVIRERDSAQCGARALRAEVERLRTQFAACMVAAGANTLESIDERITPDNPQWSAAYQAVCSTVDREIALREEAERLRKLIVDFAESHKWADQHWKDCEDNKPLFDEAARIGGK